MDCPIVSFRFVIPRQSIVAFGLIKLFSSKITVASNFISDPGNPDMLKVSFGNKFLLVWSGSSQEAGLLMTGKEAGVFLANAKEESSKYEFDKAAAPMAAQ